MAPFQEDNSPTNNPKKNKNPFSLVKSSTEVMVSSTFENSDAISLKDVMQIDITVELIPKEESSTVSHPFKNPTQSKASPRDKM